MNPKVGDLVRLQQSRIRYNAVDKRSNRLVNIYPDQFGLVLEKTHAGYAVEFDGQILSTAQGIFEVVCESQDR